jgi:hypothetical protein
MSIRIGFVAYVLACSIVAIAGDVPHPVTQETTWQRLGCEASDTELMWILKGYGYVDPDAGNAGQAVVTDGSAMANRDDLTDRFQVKDGDQMHGRCIECPEHPAPSVKPVIRGVDMIDRDTVREYLGYDADDADLVWIFKGRVKLN